MNQKSKNALAVFIVVSTIYWLIVFWVMDGDDFDKHSKAMVALGYGFIAYVSILFTYLVQSKEV